MGRNEDHIHASEFLKLEVACEKGDYEVRVDPVAGVIALTPIDYHPRPLFLTVEELDSVLERLGLRIVPRE